MPINKFIIKTPATSANLGPGFDILGVSLDLYNQFEICESEEYIYIGANEKYNYDNNLFFRSYKKTAAILNMDKKCTVIEHSDIPFSRGLGSSATLITAGVIAANEFAKIYNNDKILTIDEIFDIATEIEGHPDNISPCLFGGLTISLDEFGKLIYRQIPIDKKFYPTLFIPPYRLSTEEARAVIPKEIHRSTSIYNTSHSLLLIEALRNGDEELLKIAHNDKIHVPYRKSLIKEYDTLEKLCYKNGALSFTISGAGSSMMAISTNQHFSDIIKNEVPDDVKVLDSHFTNIGCEVIYD